MLIFFFFFWLQMKSYVRHAFMDGRPHAEIQNFELLKKKKPFFFSFFKNSNPHTGLILTSIIATHYCSYPCAFISSIFLNWIFLVCFWDIRTDCFLFSFFFFSDWKLSHTYTHSLSLSLLSPPPTPTSLYLFVGGSVILFGFVVMFPQEVGCLLWLSKVDLVSGI